MADPRALLFGCTGFQWDKENAEKNWVKHNVSRTECEEVFFNEPLLIAVDSEHSDAEPRFYVLGKTDEKRPLFMVFTIREKLIRVISARDMSHRERKEYAHAQAKEADS